MTSPAGTGAFMVSNVAGQKPKYGKQSTQHRASQAGRTDEQEHCICLISLSSSTQAAEENLVPPDSRQGVIT